VWLGFSVLGLFFFSTKRVDWLGKNVAEMTNSVSSGMQKLYSVNHQSIDALWLSAAYLNPRNIQSHTYFFQPTDNYQTSNKGG